MKERCNIGLFEAEKVSCVFSSKLGELLKFVVQQKAKYFVAEYETPDDEYLRWWASESA